MSDDSLNKPPTEKPIEGWGFWGALFLGLGAFFLPSGVIIAVAPVVQRLSLTDNLTNFIYLLVFEVVVVGLIAAFVVAYGLRLKDIGLGRFKPSYWGYSALGFVAYFVLTVAITSLAATLLQYNQDQSQELGFTSPDGVELLLTFVALVFLAPVAEELLFRGFMFRGFRRRLPFWATTLIVSLLFGLVHAQLNVGFDVFALSLVLCYLREKTGSVWPGILLHAGKNALAFGILFLL